MNNLILYKLKQLEGTYFTQTLSAAGKWLHYKLNRVSEGAVEASILVREEMTNPNKMLHGGMYAMIFDELCGLAFYSLGLPTFYTTINLHVDYLKSVTLDSKIIVKAKVTRSGKRAGHVIGEMFNENGELLAHATTNLVNTDKQIFELAQQ